MNKSIYRVFAFSLFLIIGFLVTPQNTMAGSCSTSCTGAAGSGMNCNVTAMLTCPAGFPTLENIDTQVAVSSYGANCARGAADDLMATATHMVGAGTNGGAYASCVFFFVQFCRNTAATMIDNDNVVCTVNAAGDGLPVELLEFSVNNY